MWFVEWKWFETFILFCIALNTVAMATRDYSGQWKTYNYILEIQGKFLDYAFA